MASNRAIRIKNQLLALWKMCLSVRKRDWELADYPVVISKQEVDPAYVGTRLEQRRYRAFILNWCLAASGDTKWEALEALGKTFASVKVERVRMGTSLPRPGARVPIEFGSEELIDAYPELA